MAISGDWPGCKWIRISTSLAVLSTTCFTFIFPFSLAFTIDSIKEVVVVPYGISLITSVFLSIISIFARTLTRPPLKPWLYSEKSAIPPVGKSG